MIDSDRHSTTLWWDYKGIVYFELLPPNRTISSDVYIEQLTKLNNAVEEKRPESTNRKGVVFHHDNARPHTSLVTRQKLLELGWDVLPHPPYSPDLAPSDYCLFRSLQNSSNDDHGRLLPEGWEKKIDHDMKIKQITKTPNVPQSTNALTKQSAGGEGKNAGRKTGRPKAANQVGERSPQNPE
ncbi:histone-lysine N-methyltransferase SETMAR [Trichonephila clavipes]|nr:histone-lysine N-methyltransferase SETMAR [Trichonephila clavipes]